MDKVATATPVRPGREHVRRMIQEFFDTRDSGARDQVVVAYQGLAYSLASRFSQRGEELDDLNQVALIGLLKAVDRFDPERGAELTTFATATILGELKRHLRDRGWSVRLPRRIHDLHLRVQQSIDELTQELGRSPSMFEIGQRVEAGVDDVVEALDAGGLRHNTSLEAPLVPGEDNSLTNRLGVRDQRLAEIDGRLTLSPLLERLPERQQQILNLRFVVGCSQTEIASVVGVSQMQVSRLLSRSLAQLRLWAVRTGVNSTVGDLFAEGGRGDTFPVVTDPEGLEAVISRLSRAPRYALDTEFHRERTYWPKVALVQVAWPRDGSSPAGGALIDPQSVDLAPLATVLRGPGIMVAHAAEQDLEVLEQACGTGPTRLFDTQVAAGFTGLGSASLLALSSAFLGIEVLKGDRLTDWSHRPLTASQLAYAAADVDRLLDLADAIIAVLVRDGRLSWAEEESELLRCRPHGGLDPARAWWKLRDSRALRGTSRGVAQEVAGWRELRARRLDQPVRSILPDLALQAIAHHPPTNDAALARTRGLDKRYLRAGVSDEILAASERGRHLPETDLQLPAADDVSRELRPAVALAAAWVAQLGRDERIDATLLATRADLVAYLRDDPEARLRQGWRAGLVGEPLGRLVAGDASLAFDGRGGLVIEARSNQPLQTG